MKTETLRAGIYRPLLPLAILMGIFYSDSAYADSASSETLLHEAKLSTEQKRPSENCAALEAQTERETYGQHIFELGSCHKNEGKLATAYYELREALDIAQRDRRADRANAARSMLQEIEPKMPKLAVDVSPTASSITGLQVKRDGTPVRASEWGSPMPVDPGSHAVIASAPGYKPLFKTVQFAPDGTIATVFIDKLEPVKPAPQKARPAPSGSDESDSIWSTQRKVGLITTGVGATALGVATVLSVRAASIERDSEAHCKGTTCDTEGMRLRSQSSDMGTTAAMVFVSGGLAAATGLVLFLTAPSATPERQGASTTTVGLGPTGVSIRGQF